MVVRLLHGRGFPRRGAHHPGVRPHGTPGLRPGRLDRADGRSERVGHGRSDTELEIRVYTGADARFTLYDDAGDGYGYEQGEYARCTLGWSEADAALRISAREGSYPGMAQEQTLRIRVFRPGAEPAEQTVRYTGEPLECKFQSTENR